MSFLAPLYLLLGAGAVVPLLVHLLRRRAGNRVDFPAVRYLERAEQEHRRTLRLRNLLLMVLRVLAVVLITMAAARPVGKWLGTGHPPTALAIVIDNSMSTSAVVDGHPLLEQFKRAAEAPLATANVGDRVWLVTADGTVSGGSPAMVRAALSKVEPLAGAGDLEAAMARASGLVRSAGLDARQIALLTDGQRTSWPKELSIPDVHLLLMVPSSSAPPNRAVVAAEARPGRWTPRGAIVARIESADSAPYRVTLGGRTLAHGTAAPGEEVVLNAAPVERGWTSGTVEVEPDELPGDNVRHFAVWIGPPPGVRASAATGTFVANALDVLRASGRTVAGNDISVVVGDELSVLPALIVAPSDPVRLGAANRALERAGVPWRFGARESGATPATGEHVVGATVTMRYQLEPQAGVRFDTLASAGRDAWVVAGDNYVLVGSPLTPDASTLPVRATFIPWMTSMITERLVGDPSTIIFATPGSRIPKPRWADALETSAGVRTTLGDTIDVPALPGTYFFVRGARRAGAIVVNPPASESALERYTGQALASRIHAATVIASPDAANWGTLLFRSAASRSLIEPLLIGVLIVLAGESIVVFARRHMGAS